MYKIFFILCFLTSSMSFALTANEIMKKNEEAKKNKNISTQAVLKTGGGTKPERIKEFSWWRKLSQDGVYFKTLTKFHKPKEVKNEGVLFLEGDAEQTEVLIYLPAYKKIRRVETNQQSGSFMGSEFSYADITSHHVEDYNYKLLREEKCFESQCYVIESTPNKDSVKDRTGSAKGLVYVRKDNFVDVKAEIYDLENNLWKKLEAKDVTLIDPQNNKWMALDLQMQNVKTGRFTNLKFSNVKVKEVISDSIFTKQNLEHE